MGTYVTNGDGVQVHYGTRTVLSPPVAQESAGTDQFKELVLDFLGKDLVASAPTIDRSAAFLPAGSLVHSATLMVATTFTGATATLDIGTWKFSDLTDLDENGFIAAIAVATLVAGYTTLGAGAQVGTIIAQDTYVMPTYNTAAFTAGKARLVVRFTANVAV